MQWLLILACAAGGYLLGSLNPAYFVAKYKGFDIRNRGTGNAGTSNAVVVMGWKTGVAVGFFDVAKGAVAALAAKLVFPDVALAGVVAGTACIVGHMFPFYMSFRGGKGFAAYMGMLLGLDWRIFIGLGILVIVITVVFDYIALATLTTCVLAPVAVGILQGGWIALLILALLAPIIFFKHWENIRRMLRGEEIGLRQTARKKEEKQNPPL